MEAVQFDVSGMLVIISAVDYPAVSLFTWSLWQGYPYCTALGLRLHQFVIGTRPRNIPAHYVVDHINRQPANAERNNLRWVSPSFNAWNSDQSPGTSGYRGVWQAGGKWAASFRNEYLGCFEKARDAFIEYARAAVLEWPLWAPTSDILVGNNLLTPEEMQAIQSSPQPRRQPRLLPRGVTQVGEKYQATCSGKRLGLSSSIENALQAYQEEILRQRQEAWDAHLRVPIPVNHDGHAMIKLSGANADGAVALVPPELFHFLTFGHTWMLNNHGYAASKWHGRKTQLHALVYQLLNPAYLPKLGSSIDHINHNELDNSKANLRAATASMQNRNKRKSASGPSRHLGISHNPKCPKRPWQVRFGFRRQSYSVGCFATEEEAVAVLAAKKREVIGDA